ncbi:MAG: ThiF family adenylyltransferase [Candidatus Cryptobacteroides sp.]
MEKQDIFNRTERLVGGKVMDSFSNVSVIVFGVGGVGSWCAEGLVRSGVRKLTIVDSDRVGVTNVNRQLMATTKTIGRVKVEALKERLLEINPDAQVTALQKIYSAETASEFDLDSYDYVIDAVDSLKDKVQLILNASSSNARFYCSLGAALKINPTNVRVAEFWKVRGCPLGAALRKRMKRAGKYPAKKFLCVYDDEVLPNLGPEPVVSAATEAPQAGPGDPALVNHDWSDSKAVINGTLAHITAIFGMTLCGLVLDDIYRRTIALQ